MKAKKLYEAARDVVASWRDGGCVYDAVVDHEALCVLRAAVDAETIRRHEIERALVQVLGKLKGVA